MATHYRPPRSSVLKPFDPGPHWKPASELHNTLQGRPVVVMGQAYSLNYVNLELLRPFVTIGCNRCLRPDSHVAWHPDYYVCVDRDPYAQEAGRVREFKGTRVLSEMLFDPNNLHKKKAHRTHWAPCQPVPDFEWYGFRPVNASRPRSAGRFCYTGWPDREKTVRNGIIPAFGTDLDLLIAGGANVAYSMFQIAAALGAGAIGIVGVDLAWESKKKSHSFGSGDGKQEGAFELNARHTLPYFRAGVNECRKAGVGVYNLSPRGCLSPTVPKLSAKEFHRRFVKYVEGPVLRPGEQLKPRSRGQRRAGSVKNANNRYKPTVAYDERGLAADSRRDRVERGKTATKRRAERSVRVGQRRRRTNRG